MSKTRRASAQRRRPRTPLKNRARVVSPGSACPGADPFTPLRVIAVHRDGTVDVAGDTPGDTREWHDVPADLLQAI